MLVTTATCAAVEAQALAQDAAARGLEHGRIDVGMGQHVARAARAAAVAAVDLTALHVGAVGVGHAHAQSGGGHQVRHQPRHRGLAVGAGDGHHRHAAVVAGAVEVADDGLADVAALAVGRRQVHAQPGRGVHLDHAAALLFQRAQHAFADHVDTADVQADHLRRRHRPRRHLGVHVVGDIGGAAAGAQVGVVAQHHAPALGRHRAGLQALHPQPVDGDLVQADACQRGGMAVAAARVRVDRSTSSLTLSTPSPMTCGGSRRAAATELPAHHQQPEITAGQVLLDHHRADGRGRLEGRVQVLARDDIDGHALALVAVLRLDHHRQADLLRHGPGIVGVAHRPAAGHRHAGGLQQGLGQVLVLGDGFGHGAGGVDLGGLDAALPGTPAELHQAAFGEATVGNAARDGGVDDRAGGRTQPQVLVDLAQAVHGRGRIEAALGSGCGGDQLVRQFQCQAADFFLAVLDHHLVGPGFAGGRGAAVGHRAAGLCLQRQRREFQHLGHRQRALVDGPGLGQCREQRAQARREGRQAADVALVRFAAHDGFDGRVPAPQVGPAQRADA
jgi:hypothetical protein